MNMVALWYKLWIAIKALYSNQMLWDDGEKTNTILKS